MAIAKTPMRGEEIKKLVLEAASAAINSSADGLAAIAINEAPVDTGKLRASALYPAIDPESRSLPSEAILGAMWATVSFNTPYAAAQHEGEIIYTTAVTYTVPDHSRAGYSVSEHTATIGPTTVVFSNHPGGGKDHYLSDPLKALFPNYRDYVQKAVNIALAGVNLG